MANELAWDDSALMASVRKSCVKKLKRIGGRLVNVMADNIGVQGSPGNRSDPGDPPKMDTQALRNSLEVILDEAGLSVKAGSPLDYATDLEYGRVSDHPMAPRPWLDPAFRASIPEIQRIMNS